MLTTLPIARLRAAGCRVSTVIGHDPSIGDFIYSIRVPDSAGDLREQGTTSGSLGAARYNVPKHSDGRHIIVLACAYRRNAPIPDVETRKRFEHDVAQLLGIIADVAEGN